MVKSEGFNPVPEGERSQISYREAIMQREVNSGIWDYLRYDDEGSLWINNLRIIDAIEHIAAIDSAGTPLEITDTTIIERRCREWKNLTQSVAQRVGYTGGFEYFYASKANRSSEVMHAAMRSGWNIETTSKQDIDDLEVLANNGLFSRDGLKIICNGFKFPPDYRWEVVRGHTEEDKGNIIFETHKEASTSRIESYAEGIISLAQNGFQISPILDSGEVEYFIENAPPMEVGLRLKFGKVNNDEDLKKLNSRFGMEWEELQQAADQIDSSDNLDLTMFHTMVGAAETIDEGKFAGYLSFALDKYFALKSFHPSLTHFNIGGGIPPMSEKYDHEALLETFLIKAHEKAEEYGLEEPVITFELGSYVAAEAGFYVMDVLQQKNNSINIDGKDHEWMILEGSLMEAIPDMLITQKQFTILAADSADSPTVEVTLGDLTCDSDGRYPTKANDGQTVLLPDVGVKNFIVITGVGAYQEQLAGLRGGHHCGLLEGAEIIIEKRADGKNYARVMPRQTLLDSQEIFGYNSHNLEALKKTLS